jgi:hypothetical protein
MTDRDPRPLAARPTGELRELADELLARHFDALEAGDRVEARRFDQLVSLVVAEIQRRYEPEPLRLVDAAALHCPRCCEEVWDGPRGHKLAKCWSCGLAFDTMGDDPAPRGGSRTDGPMLRGEGFYLSSESRAWSARGDQ